MDLTEIIQELCENHPEKMLVDISEYEDEEHQSYKYLYDSASEECKRLREENFSLVSDKQDLDRKLSEAISKNEILQKDNAALSENLLPAMDVIKDFCMQKIFVTNVVADAEHLPEKIFDLKELSETISSAPGIYGEFRPSWFTPLQHELSKKNVQGKNIDETARTFFEKIIFWKNNGKEIKTAPGLVAEKYDSDRKKRILELLESDCSNEEKYLKYFLLSPGLEREFLKTLEGASEMNIDARLIITLLEQPGDRFNKQIIEDYISRLHKGTEYNLKQELAEELINGKWYISGNVNGREEKFQLVPVSVIENLIYKINAINEFLNQQSASGDTPSASLAENDPMDNISEEIPSFVEFDDSMLG